jgi:superfamily II DNA or RNA helicase
LSKVEREATYATLRQSGEQERLILATGRYLGEGFDDDRLDTLFLTMPISWKGTLAQYVGRLHRRRGGKTDMRVVDYVDRSVPILVRMATKRRAGYKSLGYDILEQPHGNCWHQISSTAGKQEPQRLGPWPTWLTERDSI